MVIEAGPATVRRLCCCAGDSAEAETEAGTAAAALEYIDDPVALVDDQPIEVAALWASVLRSLAGPNPSHPESVVVVHPSWWSTTRVDLVAAAARDLADDVTARPRSWLLGRSDGAADAVDLVIEIADRLVSITADTTVAEPRIGSPETVAEAVRRRVVDLAGGGPATVRIDRPGGVGGAVALAALIADRLRGCLDAGVATVDDAWIATSAVRLVSTSSRPDSPGRRRRLLPVLVATLTLLGVAGVGAGAAMRHGPTVDHAEPALPAALATYLVEGRVALRIPVGWPVRRVTTGPGSARVEVVSPTDPEVILHLTQSVAAGDSLGATAEAIGAALRRVNSTGPPGVFVGFDPSGNRAGRPAVTYREVRRSHRIEWTVLVDDTVRISIGCQSRPDDGDAIGSVCEQAVRSARALR